MKNVFFVWLTMLMLISTSGFTQEKVPLSPDNRFSARLEFGFLGLTFGAEKLFQDQSILGLSIFVGGENSWKDPYVINMDREVTYHTFLIDSLSSELGMSQQKLNAIITLKKAYPVAAELPLTLSWAHCEILLDMEDKDKRDFYRSLSEKKQWTPDELRQYIQKNKDMKRQ